MCASGNIDIAGERNIIFESSNFRRWVVVGPQVPLVNALSCSPAVGAVLLANRIYCSLVIVSEVGSFGPKDTAGEYDTVFASGRCHTAAKPDILLASGSYHWRTRLVVRQR